MKFVTQERQNRSGWGPPSPSLSTPTPKPVPRTHSLHSRDSIVFGNPVAFLKRCGCYYWSLKQTSCKISISFCKRQYFTPPRTHLSLAHSAHPVRTRAHALLDRRAVSRLLPADAAWGGGMLSGSACCSPGNPCPPAAVTDDCSETSHSVPHQPLSTPTRGVTCRAGARGPPHPELEDQ